MNDSDLNTRLGNSFVAVKKFTMGGREIKGSKIVSVCKATLELFMQHLPEGSTAKIINPPAPIFENVNSPKLRCLMMVACLRVAAS